MKNSLGIESGNLISPFPYGSQWVRVDFHMHTKADKEFIYGNQENDFIKDYIKALKASDIKLAIITNHNKFDLGEFKNLKKKARQENTGVLPGIELSVKDGQAGIHMLVIFSEAWWCNKENKNYIQDFLNVTFSGQANFENENSHSNHNILETICELNKFQYDYFIVFAHVESSNGLVKELSCGRIKDLFDNKNFKARVLGFQKFRTRDEKIKFQQALGTNYPAEVEGCDAKSIDHIGRGQACYLKLGSFSFEAVKFALQNHLNRVSATIKNYAHSYIKSIYFEAAGALGETTISFSPELNTLIGIRGSGKSSVLEGIRYALDIPFGDKASDIDYKEKLVEHFLKSGGKIIINAVDRHGQPYQIQRILGERPQVYINSQLQPGVSIRETVLHKPIYFGQKDLSNTGAGFEKDLIEKLIGEKLIPIRQQIETQKQAVIDAVREIKKLKRASGQKQEWLQKKQDTKQKLKAYEQHKIEEKLQKQIYFEQDERKGRQIIEKVQEYFSDFKNFIATYEDELRNQVAYRTKHNQIFFEEFFLIYRRILSDLNVVKNIALKEKSFVNQLQSKIDELNNKKQVLNEEFAEIERKLAGELKQSGFPAISTQEFRQLHKTLEQADHFLKIVDQNEQQYNKMNNQLIQELAKLNDLWHQEFQEIGGILQDINKADSSLKIIPLYKHDKESMLKFMQDIFRGSRIREAQLKNLVTEHADFGSMWTQFPKIKAEISNSPEIFTQYFEQNLEHLLTWQVPNKFIIEYRGKPLLHHSLGQRASALILFVLSQKDNDIIIIDQPEDDLDNQTIYDDVIKQICEIKSNTQFIFATHNANFPVLGDAEQIVVCNYQDEQIKTFSGSIDNPKIQSKIINIMEGGEEAFKKRKQVYDIWKPQNY